MRIVGGVIASGPTKNMDIMQMSGYGKRSASICVVLGSKKASTYFSEYASGFFEPCAAHLQQLLCLATIDLPGQRGLTLFEKSLHLVEETIAVFFDRHAALFAEFLEQFLLASGQFGGNLNF